MRGRVGGSVVEEGSSVGNLNIFRGLRRSHSGKSDNRPWMGCAEVASVTSDSALSM